MTSGILLANLGSPASPETADVAKYLREFLMDERVIDIPFWKRWLLVNLLIVPFRSPRSAHAYQSIWTPEGSPLLVHTRNLARKLEEKTGFPVEIAMRYGKPSAGDALESLLKRGAKRIIVAPMYPHFAESSYGTAVARSEEARKHLGLNVALDVLPPFFEEPLYIDALVASAQPYLQKDFDHLLFSFHGLPERHIRKADRSRHCLSSEDCCINPGSALSHCYRAQCLATVRAFAERALLPREKYSVAFQSRLGRDQWIGPYTDETLRKLPAEGVKKLLVICPAFVADCLETLEEIGMRGRETFLASGGEEYTLIPCLNDSAPWVDALAGMLREIER